ncbi:MAG: hypothetical protein WCJ30_23350 [Deltaproteobacteria bacterium]
MNTDGQEVGGRDGAARTVGAARGRQFSRVWNHDDEEPRAVVRSASPLRTQPPISNYERLDRIARMIGALRLIESDLRALTPGPNGDDAHALRIGRAHALALIDVLGDVAVRSG